MTTRHALTDRSGHAESRPFSSSWLTGPSTRKREPTGEKSAGIGRLDLTAGDRIELLAAGYQVTLYLTDAGELRGRGPGWLLALLHPVLLAHKAALVAELREARR